MFLLCQWMTVADFHISKYCEYGEYGEYGIVETFFVENRIWRIKQMRKRVLSGEKKI